MSAARMPATSNRILEIASEAAVEACWRQWQILCAGAPPPESGQSAASIIDPEALVLMSLFVHDRERRLLDRVLWWSQLGASLTSVQRIQSMLSDFPADLAASLAWYAGRCTAAGDRRWKKLAQPAGDQVAELQARYGKGPEDLRMDDSATVLLRLRAGFGVGVKSDLLAYLLGIAVHKGSREFAASSEMIAQAISYSSFSVRRSASEMVCAGFIKASDIRPVTHSADTETWSALLGYGRPQNAVQEALQQSCDGPESSQTDMPSWHHWAQVFAFLAQCIAWAKAHADHSPTVQASRARDLVEQAQQSLQRAGFSWGDSSQYLGEDYLLAFESLVVDVATFARTGIRGLHQSLDNWLSHCEDAQLLEMLELPANASLKVTAVRDRSAELVMRQNPGEVEMIFRATFDCEARLDGESSGSQRVCEAVRLEWCVAADCDAGGELSSIMRQTQATRRLALDE